jgi:hypothetical protein
MMYSFMSRSGLAIAVLDSTNELSLLGDVLFGLVVLSGGMIALAALRHHRPVTSQPASAPASSSESYDAAA